MAAAEGGFMPSQSAYVGNSPQATQRNTEQKKQTLRNVTIKQIKDANVQHDDEIVIDGKELASVVLVGKMSDYQLHTSHHSFCLHDGTGAIDVSRYDNDATEALDAWEDVPGKPEQKRKVRKLEDRQYVKVIGTVHLLNGELRFKAYHSHFPSHNEAAGPVVNGMATANDIGGSGEYTPVQRAVLDYYNSDDGKSSQNGFDINQFRAEDLICA
eukprot:jgi/Astpho2/2474/Aster-04199